MNLERLIKKRVTGVPHKAVIRFPKGWGDEALADAQAALAVPVHPQKAPPAVQLEANGVVVDSLDYRSLLQLALQMTTAREILWEIFTAKAGSKSSITKALADLPWPIYLPKPAKVGVRVASTASRMYHEGMIKELVGAELAKHGASLAAKDEATHHLDVRLRKDRLTISLGLTADPLYKRGYRTALHGTASVREDITAAALRACHNWRGIDRLPDRIIVPFAGSGTLGFEAALWLGSLPPALFLGEGLVAPFPCTPKASLAHIRKKLIERAHTPTSTFELIEIDPTQAAHLTTNTSAFNQTLTASGSRPLRFNVIESDFFDWRPSPLAGQCVLFAMNPPYGLRLEDKTFAHRLYIRLAKHLRAGLFDEADEAFGFIFVPDPGLVEKLRKILSPWRTESRPFVHGGLKIHSLMISTSP